jgi:hypothetical protein
MEAVEKQMDAQIAGASNTPDLSNVNSTALYEQLLDKKIKEMEKRLNDNISHLIQKSAEMRNDAPKNEETEETKPAEETSAEEGEKE